MAQITSENKEIGNSIVSVEVITIVENSLRVILISHVNKLRKSKDIIGATALFLSLLTVLITAEFKSVVFDSNTWYGIFIVLTIAAGLYLCYVVMNHLKNKDSVDAIIEDIKAAKEGTYETYRVSIVPKDSSNPNSSQIVPANKAKSKRGKRNL